MLLPRHTAAATIRRTLLLGGALLATALVAAPSRASAASTTLPAPVSVDGAAAIALLNQQRAASGIPAVTLNQGLVTAWCPDAANGPSTGGETYRDWAPGNTNWSATSSPWDNAPFHQFSLYSPLNTQAGDLNTSGGACMGLGGPAPAPATPTFYSFLTDTGSSNVPIGEPVSELPKSPQQTGGIPASEVTGPEALLYVTGMGPVEAVSWTLTSASGTPVEPVALVDSRTIAKAGYPGLLDGEAGGIMIPRPLAYSTTYTGTVTWRALTPPGSVLMGPPETATQTFTFTTAPAPPPVIIRQVTKLQVSTSETSSRRLRVTVNTGYAAGTLTLTVPGAHVVSRSRVSHNGSKAIYTYMVALPHPGDYTLHLSFRAIYIGTDTWTNASTTVHVTA